MATPARPPEVPGRGRSATLARLQQRTFDLLVIGGGITGAGIARDAAMRGLSVALVEKCDFGSGTSSKSSKLIHGGLRYLQHYEFSLVFEAVNERTRLLRLAPHLVRPLRFLVPAYKGQRPGLLVLDCGLWLYDALSKFASPRRHKTYRAAKVLELEGLLSPDRLTGGIVYYDSMTDDARLTLENIIDARGRGAEVLSYAQVVGLLRQPDGRVYGAQVVDVLDPEAPPVAVRARVTVNATGPWSDEVLALLNAGPSAPRPPLLRRTKGVHIVVDARRLPVRHAVVMLAPQDERVIFAIPWSDEDSGAGGRTVVGTTDTDFSGDPDQVAADAADVAYLLRCVSHYFPEARLTDADVLATWAGLRPLVAPPENVSASAVSREHRILEEPGLVTIAGGKLTTFRRMAAQVVEAALPQLGKTVEALPCPTEDAPLPGAVGLPEVPEEAHPKKQRGVAALRLLEEELAEALRARAPALDSDVARHLARTYGTRARHLLPILDREARSAAVIDSEARSAAVIDSAARSAAVIDRGDAAVRLDPELPYLLAEVDLAVQEEEAVRLEDVLARRLPLLLRGRDQGLGCAELVARRMARLLGWNEARTAEELRRYRAIVSLSRAFQREPAAQVA